MMDVAETRKKNWNISATRLLTFVTCCILMGLGFYVDNRLLLKRRQGSGNLKNVVLAFYILIQLLFLLHKILFLNSSHFNVMILI